MINKLSAIMGMAGRVYTNKNLDGIIAPFILCTSGKEAMTVTVYGRSFEGVKILTADVLTCFPGAAIGELAVDAEERHFCKLTIVKG